MKKTLSIALAMLLIVVAMASPAFAAYNLKYYWIGNGDTDQRSVVQDAINAYIGPILDATVEFNIIGWGDWDTKAFTALNSGEKIDIFFTADWKNYMRSVTQNQFLALNDPDGEYGDLLEQYGQDILTSLNPAFVTGTQVNGVNYAVPTNKELTVPMGFIYNVTAAEEIGFNPDDIKELADWEPYMAKFKELHPDQYPYVSDGSWGDEPWIPGFTSLGGNLLTQTFDASDETIYSVWETADNMEHSKLMYKWMQLGYINPDSALAQYGVTDEFNAGKFLFVSQPLKGFNIKGQELVNASGNPDLKVDEIYGQPKFVSTIHTGGSMLAIPVTSQDPVIAMKYLNMMHSDTTLVDMMLFGAPETHWAVADDGRVNILNSAWYGSIAGAWTVGDVLLQKVTTNEDPEKNKLLVEYAHDAYALPSLGFRFVQDPVDSEFVALNAVSDGMDRALRVGATDPETAIPAYVEQLKAAGLDVVLAEIQKQYDEWKAAK